MPSHIFTRLGAWDDSIASNRASAAAALAMSAGLPPGTRHSQQLHALDYLEYAYLQEARDGEARIVLDELLAIADAEPKDLTGAFAFSAIPARYALERGRFDEAAKLELYPASYPWKDFPYPEAIIVFARALGRARLGRVEDARLELSKLDPIFERAAAQSRQGYDWGKQVEILRREAGAWVEQASGRGAAALELMRSAASLEDSTEKHPVTPGAIIPAQELLADLLMAQNEPAAALEHYETSLASAPNRYHGTAGAWKAAAAAGNAAKAAEYKAKLAAIAGRASPGRPELAAIAP
jgi:hypothetical protein